MGIIELHQKPGALMFAAIGLIGAVARQRTETTFQ
jgi:hypothetical protein